MIPLVNLKRQYELIGQELEDAVVQTMRSGRFIGGDAVTSFEEEFAALCGEGMHCLGVGNGTDALSIALHTLGIGPGDRVLVPANSFVATSEAVSVVGAIPTFIDCHPADHLLDLDQVESFLETNPAAEQVRAVIPVHLYGNFCDMKRLAGIAERYDLRVIEDSAQGHLARTGDCAVGTHSDFATFSFFPGKNLGAIGDAGALLSRSAKRLHRARMYANHGRIGKYDHEFEGINSRLDPVQAAALGVKLSYLQEWTRQRIANAKYYEERLQPLHAEVALPSLRFDGSHVFHLFVIRLKTANRDRVLRSLHDQGVSAGIHYPIALPNLKAYNGHDFCGCEFPVSTAYQESILSLPLCPQISEEEMDNVLHALNVSLGVL